MFTTMDDSFNPGGNLFIEILEMGNQARDMISTWGDIFMTGDVKRFYVRQAKKDLVAMWDKLENIKPSLRASAEKVDYE